MEIVSHIIAILSIIAAIVAWVAKIRWSNEYKEAKDETIRAKEAQIEQLKDQVQYYKDLTPMKIQEYYDSAKKQLEELIDKLEKKLEDTKNQLKEKNKELEKLEHNDQKKSNIIEEIKAEKEKLERHFDRLENDLKQLKKDEEEFNVIKIPYMGLATATATAVDAVNKSMFSDKKIVNPGLYLSTYLDSPIYDPSNLTKTPITALYLDTPLKKNLASWFLNRYEDPANSVPYESKEGGYQYIGNEPFDAEEVLSENFPEVDEDDIKDVVEYLESYSIQWVRKDRLSEE